MTRKHFKVIARILGRHMAIAARNGIGAAGYQRLVAIQDELANEFAKESSKFDRYRFNFEIQKSYEETLAKLEGRA